MCSWSSLWARNLHLLLPPLFPHLPLLAARAKWATLFPSCRLRLFHVNRQHLCPQRRLPRQRERERAQETTAPGRQQLLHPRKHPGGKSRRQCGGPLRQWPVQSPFLRPARIGLPLRRPSRQQSPNQVTASRPARQRQPRFPNPADRARFPLAIGQLHQCGVRSVTYPCHGKIHRPWRSQRRNGGIRSLLPPLCQKKEEKVSRLLKASLANRFNRSLPGPCGGA